MAQDHLATAGTQDTDLILSQTQMMKKLEVPSYCIFLANNAGVCAWTTKTLATAGTLAADMPIRIHCQTSVAILAQAISCSNVRGVFPFMSISVFILSKCLQPSFVVSHQFSWRMWMMGLKCL